MSELLGDRVNAAADDVVLARGGLKSNYEKLFGTPERATRTLAGKCNDCCECVLANACEYGCDEGCILNDESMLLEWLRECDA